MTQARVQGGFAHRSPAPGWAPFAAVGLALLLALLMGAGMALGSPQLAMLAMGALMVPLVVSVSTPTLIAVFLFVSFVVAGSVQYFADFKQAHWFPSLLLAAMLLCLPIELFRTKALRTGAQSLNLITSLLFLFVAVFVISVGLNAAPVMQTLVGAKHFIFPLALVALLAISPLSRRSLVKLWKGIPYLLILQLPVSAFQYFFVASRRSAALASGGISWDSVVGTFGGDPDGGGNSGALALVLAFGIATVFALYRARLITARLAWISVFCAAATMLLAEIKVLIVFVPLALLVYKRDRIFRSPLVAAAWLIGSLAFSSGLLSAYSAFQWNQSGGKQRSLVEAVEFTFQGEESYDTIVARTGEVSRGGALVRWWRLNPGRGDMAKAIFGHGPAASKVSSLFGRGTAAAKHSFTLTTSSASILLWDLGIAGFGLFVLVCLGAFFRTIRAARRVRATDPGFAAVLDSCAVGIALITFGLLYSSDAINTAPIQAMLALILGLVISRSVSADSQGASSAQARKVSHSAV